MSTFTFELFDGLTVGDGDEAVAHKTVVLKELTAAETFRAQDASEEVRKTDDGYELLASPSKLSRELMRLSIVKVGEINGVSHALLGRLSSRDLALLMDKYEEFLGLDNALLDKRMEAAKSLGKP